MARKGKSTEEIIGFLREAEVRLAQGESPRAPSSRRASSTYPMRLCGSAARFRIRPDPAAARRHSFAPGRMLRLRGW